MGCVMTARTEVDPVVLTCAVRYALGRRSYLPGLICDEVRRCWPQLGDQQEVIARDVREWFLDSKVPDPAWLALIEWIKEQP